MPSSNISSREVLKKYNVIAVVGASRNPVKDSHSVPLYLKRNGYRIIPINPAASQIFGETAYPSLPSLPPRIAGQAEVVNVFRPSEELPRIARETVKMKKEHGRPFVFWAQLGLENEEAKRALTENQIGYIMNLCIRTEYMLRS